MSVSFDPSQAAAIKKDYNLSDEQYESLKTHVGQLSPQRQAAVTAEYVLAWKALDEGGDPSDLLPILKGSSCTNMGALLDLTGWNANAAYASPGAAISALLTELAAEQREQNRNQYMAEAESIASTMKDQATDIREKADKQFNMAVVSGVINIVAGAASVVGGAISMGKMMSAMKTLNTPDLSGQLSAQASKMQNLGTIFQASSQVAQATGSIFAAKGQKDGLLEDAEIKVKDAVIEQRRAVMENLRSIDQSLTELIQKSLSSAEAIQQGLNQARSRILG